MKSHYSQHAEHTQPSNLRLQMICFSDRKAENSGFFSCLMTLPASPHPEARNYKASLDSNPNFGPIYSFQAPRFDIPLPEYECYKCIVICTQNLRWVLMRSHQKPIRSLPLILFHHLETKNCSITIMSVKRDHHHQNCVCKDRFFLKNKIKTRQQIFATPESLFVTKSVI